MTRPFLAIVTACSDGFIRCFESEKLLWAYDMCQKANHLDYTPSMGAALLMTSFSHKLKVWDICYQQTFYRDKSLIK